MVPKMFEAAGLSHKTNHSLRATATTALFEANIPEKVIQNSTGHRSLKGLRLYERVSKDQDQHVSRLLTAPIEHVPHSSTTDIPTFRSPNLAFNQQTGFSSLFGSVSNCQINIQYFNGPVNNAAWLDASKEDQEILEKVAKELPY